MSKASMILYEKLAKLAVRKGLNVQKDQPVVINANLRDAFFVRMVAEEAYKAGAKSVSVDWRDEALTRMDYINQSLETLSEVPQWLFDKRKTRNDSGACYLNIRSEAPGVYDDLDPEKIHASNVAFSRKMKPLQAYTMNNEGQWCVLGLPSADWAQAVFPQLNRQEAFDKLEEAIFAVSRVTEEGDPIQAWDEHDSRLMGYGEKLTQYQFKALHFTSELGTNLTVGLVRNHIWVGGGCFTPGGVYFDPNIPTEECFCMPEKTGTEGIVYASKPLEYQGRVIEGFWMRFEKGKVVEFGAEKEEETLKKLLEFDEGSSYLGEVALVPYDSPISLSGILFCSTLYDENAACHLALGQPYPENLKGGTEMSEEELAACGANSSMEHCDFMFGTKGMNIDGILEDGSRVPIFREGNYVI
ncbi:MAG: aminopeptidase [Lachnospiraceae bacterium]|nr:aminopeptidase [Lachnospiraceae bacterium]